VVTPDGKRTDP
jgi:hypothetical protein